MMVVFGLAVPTFTLIGHAVLWKIFEKSAGDESAQHCISAPMMRQVMSAHPDLGNHCVLENQENPIARLPLGLTGVEAH